LGGANAPLFKAGVLHLWLRCTCAAADLTAAAGQLQDLELRGLTFVEPRNTQHINSPAAPLLQARARRACWIGKTRAHGTAREGPACMNSGGPLVALFSQAALRRRSCCRACRVCWR
jgi:hypothetical protein